MLNENYSSEEFEEISSEETSEENGKNTTVENEGLSVPGDETESEPKYFKTFETKEDYQSNIDRIFNSRFKDYKETKTKYESLVGNLKNYFETNDDAKALDMFSRQMDKQLAEKKGLSIEDYRKYSLLEQKADKFDMIVRQQQANEARQARISAVRSELFKAADAIKAADSSFDLQKAYDTNSEFRRILEETGSVPQAYKAMKSVHPGKKSFSESGSSDMTAGHVSASAADLSDSEFEKYIKKIQES